MRSRLIIMSMLLCSVIPAQAQLSIGIGLPNVSIGINLPLYPELVPVSFCASHCAITGNRRHIFSSGGGRMRRHVGVNTGAMNGRSVETAGTGGIATPLPGWRRCLPINGNIPASGIRKPNSSRRCATRTTITNRTTL